MPRKKRQIRIEGNIAYVPLPHGREAIIDAEDAELVGKYNWSLYSKGYAATSVRAANGKKKTLSLHRLVMNPPDGMDIDHIHGETLDNRKSQLRFATHSQNEHNKGAPATNTSGFKGVNWSKRNKKWRAQIRSNSKSIHLGLFHSPEAAHAAYCEAAKRLHGEFARTA
jgi:hypothetical protein